MALAGGSAAGLRSGNVSNGGAVARFVPSLRGVFLLLAWLSVVLALVGVVVPGLPTVPFLLVASWAAARGSPRLHAWLHGHRHFGPLLRDWQAQGAIRGRTKALAVGMLVVSGGVLAWRIDHGPGLALLGALFAAVAVFVVTRPAPVRTGEPEP